MEVIQLVLEDLSIQTLCQSAMTSKIDDLIRLRDAGKKEPLGKPIAVPTNRPKTSHGRHLHTESVKPAATTDSSTEAMEMDPFQPVERRFGSFAELEVSFVSVTDGPTFEDGCVIKMQRKLVLVVVETVEEFRSEKFELKLARHEESKMEVLLVYPTDDVVRGRARVPACRIGAPLGKISRFLADTISIQPSILVEKVEIHKAFQGLVLKKTELRNAIIVPSPEPKVLKRKHIDTSIKLIYPSAGKDAVTIHQEDMERLDEGEFLNDNLIEFFLKYFSHSLFSDKSDDFHIFSTFFIHQLMTETSKKDKSIAYDKVSRGTRDAKIFQKKFLLIPINESLHWYLTVVVDPGKLLDEATASECQLLIFDSLHLKHRWVPPIVLEYLKHESLDKLKTEISETVTLRATYPNIQQQKNHCDCGIFVLHYAHTLLRNPKGVVEASKGRARLDTPEFGTLSEIRSRRHSFRQILLMEIKGFADRLKG